jgi:hypothetical protein
MISADERVWQCASILFGGIIGLAWAWLMDRRQRAKREQALKPKEPKP